MAVRSGQRRESTLDPMTTSGYVAFSARQEAAFWYGV
jgi:hypothetical protein